MTVRHITIEFSQRIQERTGLKDEIAKTIESSPAREVEEGERDKQVVVTEVYVPDPSDTDDRETTIHLAFTAASAEQQYGEPDPVVTYLLRCFAAVDGHLHVADAPRLVIQAKEGKENAYYIDYEEMPLSD